MMQEKLIINPPKMLFNMEKREQSQFVTIDFFELRTKCHCLSSISMKTDFYESQCLVLARSLLIHFSSRIWLTALPSI